MTIELLVAFLGADGRGERVSWKSLKKAMAGHGFTVQEAGHKAIFIPPQESHARTLTVRKPEGGIFRARALSRLAKEFDRASVWNTSTGDDV